MELDGKFKIDNFINSIMISEKTYITTVVPFTQLKMLHTIYNRLLGPYISYILEKLKDGTFLLYRAP